MMLFIVSLATDTAPDLPPISLYFPTRLGHNFRRVTFYGQNFLTHCVLLSSESKAGQGIRK